MLPIFDDCLAATTGRMPCETGRPLSASSERSCWYKAVTPSSLKRAAMVPNTGMSSAGVLNASRLRTS